MEGVVKFEDGAPAKELEGYLIMFQSLEHKVGAHGVVQADGTFRLGTYDMTDGAMTGKQRVALAPPTPPIDQPRPPSRIPARYGSFETSGIEVEIKPQANRVTVTVERVKS